QAGAVFNTGWYTLITSKPARVVAALVLIGVGFFWWFVVTDWIVAPRSYRGGIFYICVVLFTMGFHLRALYRFNRMVHIIRLEERNGEAPPGSTLFAVNQRFRYGMRTFESLLVLGIGICGVISVTHPSIQLNKSYIHLVLTYF